MLLGGFDLVKLTRTAREPDSLRTSALCILSPSVSLAVCYRITTLNMSTSNDVNPDAGWKPNGRPQSIIARDFSAALDDLFKLNGLGALEKAVEEKKDTVQSQRYQLENLDAKLRDADERLRRLEARHRRQSQMMGPPRHGGQAVSSVLPVDNEAEDSSGDSDAQGRSSPQGGEQS